MVTEFKTREAAGSREQSLHRAAADKRSAKERVPPKSPVPKFLPASPTPGRTWRSVCERRRRLPCCLIVKHVIQGCTCSADSLSEGTSAAESQSGRTEACDSKQKPQARGEFSERRHSLVHVPFTSLTSRATPDYKASLRAVALRQLID